MQRLGGIAVFLRAPLLCALIALAPATAQTQTPAADLQSSVVTLDQDLLFSGTKFGQSLLAKLDTAAAALRAENQKLDAELEAEERALTDKRPSMDPATFRPLAAAFDKRANALRTAQDAKSTTLAKQRDTNRLFFFQNILPILGDYMKDRGAVAILDVNSIIVSSRAIDITDAAIKRIDDTIGDGSNLSPAP